MATTTSGNGARVWQVASGLIATLAAGAIMWNYSQLEDIRVATARLEELPHQLEYYKASSDILEKEVALLSREVTEGRTNQAEILRRLSVLEEQMRQQ